MVMAKTNTYLADGMVHYADMHRPYIFGTWGQVLTEAILMSKAALYPDRLTPKRVEYAKAHYLGKRTDDCHGAIKNLYWLPDGANYDSSPIYDPKTDINADEAFRRAKVKGPIKTIPKVRGICVRYPGHVGVLTDPDKGIVCEFRGFDYGCVRTKLGERKWTDWYEHPFFVYPKEPTPTPEPKGDTCMIEMPIVKKTDPSKLKINDIITFYSSNSYFAGTPITHRIVEILDIPNNEIMFRVKGDANERADDEKVSTDNILGKVLFKIPKLGKMQYFLASKNGWLTAILIPAIMIILYDAYKLIKLIRLKNKLLRLGENSLY